ncbi:helix-turn-helix transcriptional regulator [Mesorhizobium sp. WSM3868]|uniref:PadR family transcriptional regulator n=1 Tax=Mesorhizobium sp. WSM3868 TaxID=2029405 RepID=UPI000BAEC2D9|nr:helix-turn-helix transcriptional regulator [Mesorhizobium sp. WSM3868]PBB36751.1 hypothetical protein CK221_16860 [Mesorhizobium sp. WSM3868]
MIEIPRLSTVEYEILNLLRAREMYGLEMVKESSRLKRGTVYVTLERMTDKGYVTSREAERLPHESGMARRIYAISGLGRKALAASNAATDAFKSWGVA